MVEGIMNVCPGRRFEMECVALIIFKYLKKYYWRKQLSLFSIIAVTLKTKRITF